MSPSNDLQGSPRTPYLTMNYKLLGPGADPAEQQGIMPETEIIAYATATTLTSTPNYASEPTKEHTQSLLRYCRQILLCTPK